MNIEKLNIIDNFFSHASSSSWYNSPKNFLWDRDTILDDNQIVVITDLTLVEKLPNKKVYGWLVESPLVTPQYYEYAKNNFNLFEGIFTFDVELLNISEKFVLIPLGGCWINENERFITEKNKLISMIYSNKKHLVGHKLRHDISNQINGIDFYGSGYKPIINKSEALKEYMFSITIENCKKDFYFSEKLIDCFITGTIPIYWGCPSIGNFFNEKGIIVFNNIDDLKDILKDIDKKYYDERKKYILENYEICKNYLVADDIIFEKLTYGK